MTRDERRPVSTLRSTPLTKVIPLLTAEVTRRIQVARIRATGFVDSAWYLAQWPDVRNSGMDPCEHFCSYGWKERRNPNRYFDVAFYQEQMPEAERGSVNPLVHYFRKGEKAGLRPVIFFDPVWYRDRYGLRKNQSALRHYLQHASTGKFSPIAEFDVDHYLATNPDVRTAGMDPFLHYLHTGYKEGRSPAWDFDSHTVTSRRSKEHGENPLIRLLKNSAGRKIHVGALKREATWFREIKTFTSAGDAFEEFLAIGQGRTRQAKVLAYYLPQYHPIPENDKWWGRGFTEWTNLARGVPRFKNHYQPRIPRDLGFYNLSSPDTLRRQVDLARRAGIFGFVYYFYWFNQRRLLERPLDMFLSDTTIDFPFCLMWTNENWTRRWDGFDDEILIAQNYEASDENALVATFLQYFCDSRYIRIDGRPLLMIYRPGLIPDATESIRRWRKLFAKMGNENPVIIMGQGFGDTDPQQFGLDGAIEFPPHKLLQDLANINREVEVLDPEFNGQVYAYDAMVDKSLSEPPPAFPLIKTAVPSWDNDARRQGHGLTVHGSTPAAYEFWLSELIKYAGRHPFMNEKFVCISAWNEWAEGAYLEPDVHFGSAYLNATARAIIGMTSHGDNKIVLVGHDAAPHGAQLILLNIARVCRRRFGMEVEVILLADGPLLATYKETAPTRVCGSTSQITAIFEQLYRRGFRYAILNSSVSAPVARPAKQAHFLTTMLVHEQPMIIGEMKLGPEIERAVDHVDHFVFPAKLVRERFLNLFPVGLERTTICPQGCYADIRVSQQARASVRASLQVAPDECVVLCLGYADLRKGFDVFLNCSRSARKKGLRSHFVWVGNLATSIETYLRSEIDIAIAEGHFHLIPFQSDISPYLSAADVFFLSSREDPFPTCVMEAVQAGIPVVAFDGTGGIPELIRREDVGRVVALCDSDSAIEAIVEIYALVNSDKGAAFRQHLLNVAKDNFAYADYVSSLLAASPQRYLQISVVVPNYNYAKYLAAGSDRFFRRRIRFSRSLCSMTVLPTTALKNCPG